MAEVEPGVDEGEGGAGVPGVPAGPPATPGAIMYCNALVGAVVLSYVFTGGTSIYTNALCGSLLNASTSLSTTSMDTSPLGASLMLTTVEFALPASTASIYAKPVYCCVMSTHVTAGPGTPISPVMESAAIVSSGGEEAFTHNTGYTLSVQSTGGPEAWKVHVE